MVGWAVDSGLVIFEDGGVVVDSVIQGTTLELLFVSVTAVEVLSVCASAPKRPITKSTRRASAIFKAFIFTN